MALCHFLLMLFLQVALCGGHRLQLVLQCMMYPAETIPVSLDLSNDLLDTISHDEEATRIVKNRRETLEVQIMIEVMRCMLGNNGDDYETLKVTLVKITMITEQSTQGKLLLHVSQVPCSFPTSGPMVGLEHLDEQQQQY